MAAKSCRNMKIYEQSAYHYKSTPTIMLKGLWLKEFGFSEGTQIQVQCEDDKLISTKAQEPIAESNLIVITIAAGEVTKCYHLGCLLFTLKIFLGLFIKF